MAHNRMEERLNELRLVIEKLGTHQNYLHTTRNVWEQRIREMEATMTPPSCFPTHELNEVCSICG